jgi:hypothetical protein
LIQNHGGRSQVSVEKEFQPTEFDESKARMGKATRRETRKPSHQRTAKTIKK